ncbi:hypothetical protein B566_EDAN011540, partial [Ephemera danica]
MSFFFIPIDPICFEMLPAGDQCKNGGQNDPTPGNASGRCNAEPQRPRSRDFYIPGSKEIMLKKFPMEEFQRQK